MPLINESFVDDRLKLDRDGDLNLRYYRQWITDHFGALMSWQALGHSRLTFRSQGKVMFMPTSDGMPYILSDGSWGEDPTRLKERANNARGRNQEKRFMHIYRVMALMFTKTLEQHRAEGQSLTGTMDTRLISSAISRKYASSPNLLISWRLGPFSAAAGTPPLTSIASIPYCPNFAAR